MSAPVTETLQQLQLETRQVLQSATQLGQEGLAWLSREARARPLSSLGLAAACGFLLASRMPPGRRSQLLALAGRFALNHLQALPAAPLTSNLEKLQ